MNKKSLIASGFASVALLGGLTACGNSTKTAAGTDFKAGQDISVQQFLDTYVQPQQSMKAVHAVTTDKESNQTTTLDSQVDLRDGNNKKLHTKVSSSAGNYEMIVVGKDSWVKQSKDPSWTKAPTDPTAFDTMGFTSAKLMGDMKSSKTTGIEKIHYDGKDGDNDKYTATVNSKGSSKNSSTVVFEFNKQKYLVSFEGSANVNGETTNTTLKQSNFDADQQINTPG